MTEEIIIDGVNVAGCEFYLQDEKYSCDLSFINQEELCKCDDVQDCTYKQLQRLEQENFALTQESQQKSQTICELEQENKELKEENKTLNYQWHKQSEIGDEWYKVADKYKTALEEMSGLASPHCTQCSQIIKIIKEVLQ